MRICFSMHVNPDVPCGGGAKFSVKFAEYMQSQGHTIEYFFKESSPPDCVIFFDHKLYSGEGINKWIGLEEAKKIKSKFPKLPIITRVNDIGPPKDRPIDFVDRFCSLANISDHVIFISQWLKDDYYKDKIKSPSTVIYNSVDESVFTTKKYEEPSFDTLKLFSHHWSPCRMKGWDIYEQIDKWISDKNIKFTFAGNLPPGVKLQNSQAILPVTGTKLAEEIRKHDVYITASEYEPCGMHHIEGIACGLPYLYSAKGGGLKEAGKYGIEFTSFNDFKQKLKDITRAHLLFYNKIKTEFNLYNRNHFPKYKDIVEKTLQT